MTKITLVYGSGLCNLHIEGHAGYNPEERGKDIVCAGVSVLAYTFVNAIRNLTLSDLKVRDLSFDDQKDGIIDLSFDYLAYDREIVAIIDTIRTGFEMMAEKYSDFVTLQVGKA